MGGGNYFAGSGWCRFGAPTASFVHMGISPGKGDFYNAQLADQWLDVTDVTPGDYTLRATVNPFGTILETTTDDNVLEVTRTVPGAIADPTSAAVPADTATQIELAGTVVGADVHSVKNASCSLYSANCYITADPDELDFDIIDTPAHGAVLITSEAGTSATAIYNPDALYAGPDTFTFTVTDSRGLESAPVAVTIEVLKDIPINTSLPGVTGAAEAGQTLAATAGTWTPPGSLTFTYQWQSCDGAGLGCAHLPGAVGTSYLLTPANAGATIRVLVTATSSGGSSEAASAVTGMVTAPPPAEPLPPSPPPVEPTKARKPSSRGTANRDIYAGTRLGEIYYGRGGNDRISGRAGDDVLRGGAGRDTVRGNSGDDKILGGRGSDKLFGGSGDDTILGGRGNDLIDIDDGNPDIAICGLGKRDTVLADALDEVHRSCENVTIV